MEQRAFSSVPITERLKKPRNSGLTMMFEYGMGLMAQEDMLSVIKYIRAS